MFEVVYVCIITILIALQIKRNRNVADILGQFNTYDNDVRAPELLEFILNSTSNITTSNTN